ncbi:MAG: response regulator transcription factor, partial [Chloroflexota bacterium]
SMMDEASPDLILLDLKLPDVDGLVLCADLRAQADVPIIVCSGTAEKRDSILAFKLGADDFIAKPFDADDLLARVQAVLRRAARHPRPEAMPPYALPRVAHPAAPSEATPTPRVSQLGDLVLDHARRHVTLGGQPLHLTPTEYRLLAALISRPDEVLSRQELAQLVWGYQEAGVGRSIDVHIRRLRAKLDSAAVPPPMIVSVRGFGYKIVPPRHQVEPGETAAAPPRPSAA